MGEIAVGQIPAHIPAERIFDFDLYAVDKDDRLSRDVQIGLTFLQSDAPDVFYTPANGGHWVVTRYDLMCEILKNPAHFSSANLNVPKSSTQQRLIPLALDPPDHTPYRQILMRYFSPKAVQAMEPHIREKARKLIAEVVDDGACEFMDKVAVRLPVFVFMELMGLPIEKFGEFRAIVVEWFGIPNGPRRNELAGIILSHLRSVIEARRTEPRDDLVTRLLAEEIEGRRLTQAEIESISFLLFLAGLDTVANGAGFLFQRLASLPDVQAKLRNDASLAPAFVEEGLRTSGVVNTARVITQDIDFAGVRLLAGEMIVCPLALAGYDERVNDDPSRFDIARRNATHLMFSTGPHLCVGHVLARLELRVLVEEWMRQAPQFSLNPNYVRHVRIGSIIGLSNLDLVWTPNPGR